MVRPKLKKKIFSKNKIHKNALFGSTDTQIWDGIVTNDIILTNPDVRRVSIVKTNQKQVRVNNYLKEFFSY